KGHAETGCDHVDHRIFGGPSLELGGKYDPKSVRKIRRIAEKLVDCALNGEPWAISQVADRIDGKATAEIQTEQRHRYVIEAPAQLTREQWIETYSPKPIV